MSIKKLDDGRWLVDSRPAGTYGKRFRRKFDSKSNAVIYERHILQHYHDKDWLEKPPERRQLVELLDLWWKYHGKNHPYGESERVRIMAVINDMRAINITRSDQLTRQGIINYRLMMLNKGIKQSTVNRYCAMMSGFFTKLINVEEYGGKNPFHEVKRLKAEQTEMSYLSQDEITRLLELLSGDDLKAVMVCLATGGRWSEVTGLKGEHVIGGKVVFMKTKNGKRRAVPIDAELEKVIKVRTTGLLMKPSYTTVRSALKEVKADLHGQAVHVLRHTFATHFMINGGNIITLQRILGHATIQQTMTYAHFAPDYLADAMKFNPVAGISLASP
ncbi:tyrosine-type recombinase/integrase [Salmonella enterica]|nr:site-specific integrase [Salmonella enterica]EHK3913919.1 tyrosine-type recombinase/integrase [Salmonella enterica subsp. enterica serovar Poona]EKO0903477.1 tyrosine-type recombinase/integrase [Salmonella enterica subsp. enterica]MII48557.1 site-specific integrase [Salmonella enterica subsp. enterica serovar Bredeney]EBT7963333.1 tyrosine-type recombinase/integrase [Salmonella enterica]